MSDTPEPVVYVIGKNQDKKFNIYKTTPTQAAEFNQTAFSTWMKARRHIRGRLEETRAQIMAQLFITDRDIRNVERLRESHCRELKEEWVSWSSLTQKPRG